MKKISLILVFALVLGMLSGCAGTPVIYVEDCTCPSEGTTEPTTPATQPTAPATKPTTPTQPGVNPTAVVAIAVMGGLVGVAVIALIVLAVVKRKK
jgi:hypothetical protein